MLNVNKRKSNENSIESDILSGSALDFNDEVSFIQNVKKNNHNYLYP